MPTKRWWEYQPGDYNAASNYHELGESTDLEPLPNNIAYYLEGTENTVIKLKLVLNVNAPRLSDSAHASFAQAGKTLYHGATGREATEALNSVLLAGKDKSGTGAGCSFVLKRIDWPTGRGYELQFIITKSIEQ